MGHKHKENPMAENYGQQIVIEGTDYARLTWQMKYFAENGNEAKPKPKPKPSKKRKGPTKAFFILGPCYTVLAEFDELSEAIEYGQEHGVAVFMQPEKRTKGLGKPTPNHPIWYPGIGS